MKNPIMGSMIMEVMIIKKNLLITLGSALALFIYGYLASTVGHDHSSHSSGNVHIEEEYSHGDHSH